MERKLLLAAVLAALPFACGDDVPWDDGAVRVTPNGLPVADFDWADDGFIVGTYYGRLYIINSENGRYREVEGKRGFAVTGGVCWSPDGEYIGMGASYYEDLKNIYVLKRDADSVDEARQLTEGGGTRPAWSPDGKFIAYTSNEGVSIIPVEVSRPKLEVANGYYPSWSPDGGYLVYTKKIGTAFETTDLYLKRVGFPEEKRLTKLGLFLRDPDWSPGGHYVAVTVYDVKGEERKNDIWAIPVKGGEPIKVTDEPGTNYRGTIGADCPRWTPDGKWVAFYSPRGEHIGQDVSPAVWKVRFKPN